MSKPDDKRDKQWLDSLAEQIKQQGRDAAEAYGRDQHRAGIIAEQGKAFFTALTLCLEQDFTDIRLRLQGSAIASETVIEHKAPTELHLTRARFPWFDATLRHEDATLFLNYAKERGMAPDSTLIPNRHSASFTFQVDPQDRLSLIESFAGMPRSFDQPEALSRHLVEILFTL